MQRFATMKVLCPILNANYDNGYLQDLYFLCIRNENNKRAITLAKIVVPKYHIQTKSAIYEASHCANYDFPP